MTYSKEVAKKEADLMKELSTMKFSFKKLLLMVELDALVSHNNK